RPPVKGSVWRGWNGNLLDKDGPAVASAWLEHDCRAFLKTELPLLGSQLLSSALLRSRCESPSLAAARRVRRCHAQQVAFGKAHTLRIEMSLNFLYIVDQDDRTLEFATILLQVGRIFCSQVYRFAVDSSIGTGRPGLGECQKWYVLRRCNIRREGLERPSAAEGTPGFEMDVLQSPFSHLLLGPFLRRFDVGGPGQPWSVDIGQVAQSFHYVRMLHAFFFDFVDGGRIEFFVGFLAAHRCSGKSQQSHHQQHHAFSELVKHNSSLGLAVRAGLMALSGRS